MTHSSQRRGLETTDRCKELCIIGMIPKSQFNRRGIKSAMRRLARTMLDHQPNNFIFRDFTEITIPNLGAAQNLLEWLHKRRPELSNRIILWILAHTRSGLSGVYTDLDAAKALITELAGDWRSRNQQKGYPVSIVLSGLPEDVRACCQAAGLTEHTFLHSLDVFGSVEELPPEEELALITMCGHGLIAAGRVRHLAERIRKGKLTPEAAAEEIWKPCVCGIVNRERAAEIFSRLASQPEPEA